MQLLKQTIREQAAVAIYAGILVRADCFTDADAADLAEILGGPGRGPEVMEEFNRDTIEVKKFLRNRDLAGTEIECTRNAAEAMEKLIAAEAAVKLALKDRINAITV